MARVVGAGLGDAVRCLVLLRVLDVARRKGRRPQCAFQAANRSVADAASPQSYRRGPRTGCPWASSTMRSVLNTGVSKD